MNRSRLLLLASLALPAAACGTQLKAATADQIGCPADEIEIRDQATGWSTFTWTAVCHNKRHYCSRVGTGPGTHQVTCSAEQTTPPPTPGGCQNDAQCKGDRVCEAGKCIDPKPR